MYEQHSVAVVVMAYDEEKQISGVLDSIPDFVDEIIVVDDCSKDATVKVVREHALFKENRITLFEHEVNLGVGGTLTTGHKYARDQNHALVAVMAGDGQMNPYDLSVLLQPLVSDQTDFVKGNRLASGEAFREIPKARYLGNVILSFFTKIASGYWHIADSQSGFSAMNGVALRAINWDQMYQRYGQPNDLLVKLNVAGMRVMDVPVAPVYNIGEESKLKIHKVILPISLLLAKLFVWRLVEKYVIRNFHPLVLFYAIGFLNIALGAIFLVRLAVLWFIKGSVPELTLMIFLFSTSLGCNSIFFAMWFDYDENKHLNRLD